MNNTASQGGNVSIQDLEQARRDLVRNQDLVTRQLVSQQALETAGTQVDSLAAQVEAQRKQVQLARATVQGAQVQLTDLGRLLFPRPGKRIGHFLKLVPGVRAPFGLESAAIAAKELQDLVAASAKRLET